ncbi:MAG TPA: type II secretion system secretin GspD [Acetobacteraceae bacterium]|nr:type II secretion system secretin GspD [Acetobacteraceae bacterium]
MKRWWLLAIAPILVMAGCQSKYYEPPTTLEPLPPASPLEGAAAPRVNGPVGNPNAFPPALTSTAAFETLRQPPAGSSESLGPITLDFADTDIREAASQILGGILHVNFSIDPAVKGTATLHTATPMTRAQLVATLQSLLAANNATMVETAGFYRVVPAAGGAGSLSADGASAAVPLRYASAVELAKVLQPFLQTGGRIAADPGSNALVVVGDPATREALIGLIRAFDVDTLSGQSYALFPVSGDDAQGSAQALQVAFRSQNGGALANLVRVVPMQAIKSVLIIASQPSYIEDARRVFSLIERGRQQTVRSWHVYYLQNSRSNDVAYVLQQAFTPGHVTAVPTPTGSFAPGTQTSRVGGMGGGIGGGIGGGGIGGGGLGGGGLGGGGLGGGQLSQGGLGAGGALTGGGTTGGQTTQQGGDNQDQAALAANNPLLGGLGGALDQSSNANTSPNTMHIIPNNANNAILIYGTPQEVTAAEAMLHKVDILPLQVLIEAVIAEVTLNDNLQYGTQFFFKSHGVDFILNNATQTVTGLSKAAISTAFPGFAAGSPGPDGAPFVIQALQAVTQVNVLSSPQIMVTDNHPARLQVGQLVPYLTQSSQSTISANAPVVNSVGYQETGVITEVTPRVNSGGLVTLDISQEVSNVDNTAQNPQIQSPTFFERSVQSRVVVQDGQTIGLAGLIQDTSSRGNNGIPWLKDVPILGFLAGTQNNSRQRTELLLLITPRVIHDQRDARAATEELRQGLANAALIPQILQGQKLSGSPDPGQKIRRRMQME